MARDLEYRTGNRHIRYPLTDNAKLANTAGELDDTLARAVFGCFIDAMVQIKSPFVSVTPKLGGISLSGHTLSFSLTSSDTTKYPTTTLKCTRSTTRFPVIAGENAWCWYTFILSSDGIREFEEQKTNIGDISGNVLDFSVKCIGASATFVSSLWVYGGEQTDEDGNRYTRTEALLHDPDVKLSGQVGFRPGYNMRFGTTTAYALPDETLNGLVINAEPGAGAGTVACTCESLAETYKTPGLLCRDGHVRLFNDTCYDIVPELLTATGDSGSSSGSDSSGSPEASDDKLGRLNMHVKCKACCTCEMYEDIVENRLAPLARQTLTQQTSITTTNALYEKYVALWNKRVNTVMPEDIIVGMTITTPDSTGTNLSGSGAYGLMSRCGFSVMLRNDAHVDVIFKLAKFLTNGEAFEGRLSYMKDKNTPVTQNIDLPNTGTNLFSLTLDPGRSATLTYYVRKKNKVKTEDKSGYMSAVYIDAYQGLNLVTTVYRTMSK